MQAVPTTSLGENEIYPVGFPAAIPRSEDTTTSALTGNEA